MWQKFSKTKRNMRFLSAAMGLSLLGLFSTGQVLADTQVIELTQTGCQFLEPEGKDHGYKPTSAADCKTINNENGDARLANVEPLTLKPGKYIFRVTNQNVPYGLGFWLRGTGVKRVVLPSVSGGGLAKGTTQDYEIELKPGEYVYSCPLNPTPDYPIVVKG